MPKNTTHKILSEASAGASQRNMATEPQIGSYIIDDSQPPYESPLDMQYPTHFDDSAELINFVKNGHPVFQASRKMDKEFALLREKKDFGCYLGVSQAITGAARARNPLNPNHTPLFIDVQVSEGYASKIREFHADLVDLVKRHFPQSEFSDYPGLTTPVLRYFTNRDAAFSADPIDAATPEALKEISDSLPALDSQYPAHFDSSAELISFLEDEHPVYEASVRLQKDVELLREKRGFSFSADVSEAVTILARAQNSQNPARTPFFIDVRLNIHDVNNIMEFHDEIVELVKHHFPKSEFPDHPGLTTPVLRYFLWDTCWPG